MINITFETALKLELDNLDKAYEVFKEVVTSPTVLNQDCVEVKSSLNILKNAVNRIFTLKQVAADAKELAVKANLALP
jgi:hypothetical protein